MSPRPADLSEPPDGSGRFRSSTDPEEPWRAALRRLWTRLNDQRLHGAAPHDSSDWGATVTLLGGLGVGLRETFAAVLDSGLPYEAFEAWIVEQNGGSILPERLAQVDLALRGARFEAGDASEPPILDAADLAFFDEHGYVVVREAIDRTACAAAERAIWSFLEMDRDDPETWYRNPHGHTIWIPLIHDAALEANRRAARIRRAFAQLWERDDVWPNHDQCGFNPPERPGWRFPGPNLHWDTALVAPVPFGLQGILYLVDVAEDQGAFTCVPGFHRRIDDWLGSLGGTDPRIVPLASWPQVPVAAGAGDLVIWHHALPHGSSPNRASRPRIVQYVTYTPSLWKAGDTWV